MATMKAKLDLPKEDIESLTPGSGWDSATVVDLAKLMSENLHICFQNAIKKITENGYSKETAEEMVLKCGPFYGIEGMISCIVDRALACLKIKRCHKWYTFNDLNSLVEYMILEMVTMLRDVKPSLSVHEAMWTLLICDLNVLVASEAEIDPQKFSIRGLSPVQEACPSSQTQGLAEAQTQTEIETSAQDKSGERIEEKCSCCKNWCSGHKRDTLRRKPFRVEKPYKGQMSKKALKAKLAGLGKLSLDKKQSPFVNKKTPTLPLKETEEKPKVSTPKPEMVQPETPKTADYYLAGIPYDESKGEHVPQDDKDIMILTAVGQLELLQKEVKSWDDWANLKVMQVAKRLSHDRPEINKLKAEKEELEKLKKDKEVLEESTKKKLSEITAALNTTDCQIQMSSSTIARLESENSVLKRERERAENRSLIEANNLEEALIRELEALNKSESFVSEKNLLEEDLKSLKREVAPKRRELEKAKHLLKEIETRLSKEQHEAAKFLETAESIRTERERLEAFAKANEERAIKKAGKELKKFETEIKRIQYEIAALNLEAETKKIAAMRTGMSRQLSEGTSWSEASRNNFTHRECVMCLTEEMTVVFVPCGHQVLCDECNVIHEENGMKECPSCRTPIQHRITARFAKS